MRIMTSMGVFSSIQRDRFKYSANLHAAQWDGYDYFFHFTEEETKAPRNWSKSRGLLMMVLEYVQAIYFSLFTKPLHWPSVTELLLLFIIMHGTKLLKIILIKYWIVLYDYRNITSVLMSFSILYRLLNISQPYICGCSSYSLVTIKYLWWQVNDMQFLYFANCKWDSCCSVDHWLF